MPKKECKFSIAIHRHPFKKQVKIYGHFPSIVEVVQILGTSRNHLKNYSGDLGNLGTHLVKKHGKGKLIITPTNSFMDTPFVYHVEHGFGILTEFEHKPVKKNYKTLTNDVEVMKEKIAVLGKVILQQEKILNMLESREFISDAIELRNKARNDLDAFTLSNDSMVKAIGYAEAFDDLFDKWGLDV